MSIFSPFRPNIGVSSWALHAELGAPPFFGVSAGNAVPGYATPDGAISLLQFPVEIAKRGFNSLHICHFHLPTLDDGYLQELRSTIGNTGLNLHALLIDDGDITHPENGARDVAWIKEWLPVAAALGAENVRVIGGKTAYPGALERSISVFNEISIEARELGVGVLTENWFDVLSTPQAVYELLDRTEGRVELLFDFGNWGGEDKYEKLAAVAPRAVACHAKSDLSENLTLDEADYDKCLRMPFPEDFSGPYILVNGGWQGIEVNRDFIRKIAETK